VLDRRVWHMRSPNLCGPTRKALFYAYTFRWVRARDDLDIRADLLPLITPVRAQLLGNGGSSFDFWKPERLELAGTGTSITTLDGHLQASAAVRWVGAEDRADGRAQRGA